MGEPARWEELQLEDIPTEDHRRHLRMLEAMLFAATEPLSRGEIELRMPEGIDLDGLLSELQTA